MIHRVLRGAVERDLIGANVLAEVAEAAVEVVLNAETCQTMIKLLTTCSVTADRLAMLMKGLRNG